MEKRSICNTVQREGLIALMSVRDLVHFRSSLNFLPSDSHYVIRLVFSDGIFIRKARPLLSPK